MPCSHPSLQFSYFSRMFASISLIPVFVILFSVTESAQGQASSEEKKPDAPEFSAKEIAFFEKEVLPLLQSKCLKCHGGEEKIRGGFSMANRGRLLDGGDSGEVIDFDDPGSSILLEAINYEGFEMPPDGKMPQKQIDILTRWVKLGAPWKPDFQLAEDHASSEDTSPKVNTETKNFWSFKPVVRPEPTTTSNAAWNENPIDSFIFAKLQEAGLAPAEPASKTALLRRAYYDLTGLPPSPQDIDNFLNDDTSQAFEKVIDRLLESPHYGQRWARHWLDLVRYAETNSYERDNPKPNVWRYRDYVIDSFNQDKPYDQFIIEQLAGDELPDTTPETIIATGYYRLGIWDDEPSDPKQALYDDLDDIVSTTGQVMLGLTLNCARCHDHKLDPIPQKDYYRLLAFFGGLNRYGVRGDRSVEQFSLRPIASAEQIAQQQAGIKAHEKLVTETNEKIRKIEDLVRNDFIPVEKEEFRDPKRRLEIVKKRVPKILSEKKFQEYADLLKQRNQQRRFRPTALDQALCVTEIGSKPRDVFTLIRGNPHSPGEQVTPGFPSVLSPPEPKIEVPKHGNSSGRRLALAHWIASADNPLTARVMANRIWQHHFGRGIVRSSNDFGQQGTPPTHPKLLDYLAGELINGRWRLKALHKLIMLSKTYQMSSRGNSEGLTKDAENNYFWRFNPRRLAAEELRDSILAVNGSLNPKMGGPSIYPTIPQEVLHGQSQPGRGWGKSSPEEQARRSIYIHIKRSLTTPILASFDVADTDSTCPIRFATTQPTQALGMLNSDFLNEQAEVFAEYLQKKASGNAEKQVRLALRRALQREPSEKEVSRGLKLIKSMQKKYNLDATTALKYYCLVVLNLNEFIYLD